MQITKITRVIYQTGDGVEYKSRIEAVKHTVLHDLTEELNKDAAYEKLPVFEKPEVAKFLDRNRTTIETYYNVQDKIREENDTDT